MEEKTKDKPKVNIVLQVQDAVITVDSKITPKPEKEK